MNKASLKAIALMMLIALTPLFLSEIPAEETALLFPTAARYEAALQGRMASLPPAMITIFDQTDARLIGDHFLQ